MLEKLRKFYLELGLEGLLIRVSVAEHWPRWLVYYTRIDLYAARKLRLSEKAVDRMRSMLDGIDEASPLELEGISEFWCANTRGMQGQAGRLSRSLRRDYENLGLKICCYKGEEGLRGFLCAYTRLRLIPAPGSGGDRLIVRCAEGLVCMGYGLIGPNWRLSRLFAGLMKYRFDSTPHAPLFVADVSPLNRRSYKSLENLGFVRVLEARRIKILGVIRFWLLSFSGGRRQLSFSRELEIVPETLDEAATGAGLEL